MNLLYKYLIGAGILAVVLFAGFTWHNQQVQNLVRETQREMQVSYDKKLIRLVEQTAVSSNELRREIEKVTEVKQAEIASINSKHNDIIASLQQRTERPTSISNSIGSTSNTESTQGATGVQLYRSDASFLARFSRDAAQLQAELISCYNQYDKVKDAIDKFKQDNPIRFISNTDAGTTAESNGLYSN